MTSNPTTCSPTFNAPANGDVQPKPAAQLTAIASLADPNAVKQYKPTKTDLALAGALFTTFSPTWIALASNAGVSPETLDNMRENPVRAAWVVTHGSSAAALGLGAVHVRLLDKALSSQNVAWARLYMERFDDAFHAKIAPAGDTRNTQINFISSMSDQELQSFIRQTFKRVTGDGI